MKLSTDARRAMMEEIHAAVGEADDKFLNAIWSRQDGYGETGYVPPQGFDWSGIRDSTDGAVVQMYSFITIHKEMTSGNRGKATA